MKLPKVKIRKTQRSIYIPIADLEEIENIIQLKKGMNVNKVVNEGLQLWLKQNRKKGESK